MPLATEAIAPYVKQVPGNDVEPGLVLGRFNAIATIGARAEYQPNRKTFATVPVRETSSGTDESHFIFIPPPSHGSNQARADAPAAESLVARIARHLKEDIETACEDDEAAPSKDARELCLKVARRLQPFVTLTLDLKCAAFTRDDGSVELLLHSLVSKRELTLRVAADGSGIFGTTIDEQLRHSQRAVSVDDDRELREIARWLEG